MMTVLTMYKKCSQKDSDLNPQKDKEDREICDNIQITLICKTGLSTHVKNAY